MSDFLPIAEVPESTWLRALAHALDPEAESADESLAPDDEPVGAASDDAGSDEAGHDAEDDDSSNDEDVTGSDDTDLNVWDAEDDWSPSDDTADGSSDLHHDDGIG